MKPIKPLLNSLFCILIFASCNKPALIPDGKFENLDAEWTLISEDSSLIVPATVPGNIFSDLQNAGIIKDPFYADHEKKYQWVNNQEWIYQSEFEISDSILLFPSIQLVFEGLDTYCQIRLNDSLILNTDNMFRTWNIEVKPWLRHGKNKLRLSFSPPQIANAEKAAHLPYSLPDQRVFTRKAPYHFGWDWGPTFTAGGIWKPIYLRTNSGFYLENFATFTRSVSESVAEMRGTLDIISLKTEELFLEISINGEKAEKSYAIDCRKGHNTFSFDFPIVEPEIWWPAGYGNQPLYDIEVTVSSATTRQTAHVSTGVRTARLVQEPDSTGSSFYFEINGKAIFAKGANYIPQDNFYDRMDSVRYEKLFHEIEFANMNMIRIWGGGIYENDYFYKLADEKGILIWQDFMYACAMYPGDDDFLQNASIEAEQQIKRIRKHPSIVLWCGNNESENGWQDWGWQKQLGYSEEDSTQIYEHYLQLFHSILPELVIEHHYGTDYHPSSPTFGWGHEESNLQGDSHYWGIWWGMEDFEVYERKTGRFMSEYGFQGFPSDFTLHKYIPKENLENLYDTILLVHQKHPTGNQTIESYMKRYYPVPQRLDELAYVSQLLQAYGMDLAIRYHRAAAPHCMGTLYWQLNDCWPVISWSGLDYQYRRKALHYTARETFQQMLIYTKEEKDSLEIGINLDGNKSVRGKLIAEIIDFKGKKYQQKEVELQIEAGTNQIYINLELSNEIKKNKTERLAVCRFVAEGKEQARYLHYFVRPKDLKLSKTSESLNIQKVTDTEWRTEIILQSPVLRKNVYLYVEDFSAEFSDNYFDILPGETKKVWMEKGASDLKILYRTLNELQVR